MMIIKTLLGENRHFRERLGGATTSDVLDNRLSDVRRKEKECLEVTLTLLEDNFQCPMYVPAPYKLS